MKSPAFVAFIMAAVVGDAAFAQGEPSGRGSITGDPAASSANPSAGTTGAAPRVNPSGSGTSTSGGRDANGDGGHDKMPESDRNVIPLQDQHKRKEMQ